MDSSTFVINVGRQLGSGGHEVAEKLAQRLQIPFYDKELIRIASEESGLCPEVFEKADERASQSFLSHFWGLRFPFVGDSAVSATNCLSNDALFQVQSDVIRKLASDQSALFVGRCADYILRDHPRCVNLFISSSPSERIKRLCQLHHVSETAAEEWIEKADDKRASYYNYYTFKQWGAAASYHLCIDSSVLGIEGTVDFAEDFIHRKLSL